MHIVTQPIRVRSRRKVYLPHERVQVNGIGLGEVDGLFNLGKMFKRFTHITPRSFQPKNIFGAIGSVALTGATFGLAPKISGAHSKAARITGMAVAAAGAAIGGGFLLAPMMAGGAGVIGAGATAGGGGFMSTIGGIFSGAGGGIMKMVSGAGGFLKPLMGMFGGGGGRGGGGQQQYAPYEQPYAYPQPQQPQQYYDPMAAYNMNVARSAGAPLGGGSESYQPSPNTDYSQQGTELLSPDKGNLQYPIGTTIDPATGQLRMPVQAGMFPDLSGTTWLIIGGVTMVGWYLMPDSKKEIGNA